MSAGFGGSRIDSSCVLMSLKRNLLANYLGQFYVVAAGVLALPIYVKQMGAEAYGLVVFYSMLQLWFQLLDMGLSQMLTLQAGRFRGRLIEGARWMQIFKSSEIALLCLGLLGGGSLFLASGWIASGWLHLDGLPVGDVLVSIVLMAGLLFLRIATGAHRSVLVGYEEQIWINGVGVVFGTGRILGVLAFMAIWGATSTVFLSCQLLFSVAEAVLIVWKAWKILPGEFLGGRTWVDVQGLLSERNFIASTAITSSLWLIISYLDRLVLSRLLPLSNYAYYGFAVTAASSVVMIGLPTGAVLQPRMTRLVAQDDLNDFKHLYSKFTQFLCVLVFPVACMLTFFPEAALWVWTGNAELAAYAAMPLSFLVLGNAVFIIAAFAYYLQNAFGDLRLHLRGNVVAFVIFVPSLLGLAFTHGASGAAFAWFAVNLLYFIIWIPVVHRKFLPGFHGGWLVKDVLMPAGVVLAACYLVWCCVPVVDSRPLEAMRLCLSGGFVELVALASASEVRVWVWRSFKK